MKIKSFLIVFVCNIFLMLMFSVLFEYINLTERFESLETSIRRSLESAVETAVATEEMFTDKFQQEIASVALGNKGNDTLYATTLLWRDGRWYQVNSYQFAQWYDNTGRMPKNSADMSAISRVGVADGDLLSSTYNWLYGGVDSDYEHNDLAWANRSSYIKKQYNEMSSRGFTTGGRSPSTELRLFYDNVGKYQNTMGYLKKLKKITSTLKLFELELLPYPTLLNMGVVLDEKYNGTSEDVVEYTSDNFSSSYHVGKVYNESVETVKNTIYYLTPASLGVTYIPTEVLKPIFLANLETTARLQKFGGGNYERSSSIEIANGLNSADECLSLSVFEGEPGSRVQREHDVTDYEDIITDGMVEYDLNSAKVKVDYFYVDFNRVSDVSGQTILTRVDGTIPNKSTSGANRGFLGYNDPMSLRLKTLEMFRDKELDSMYKVWEDAGEAEEYDKIRGGRIIARVSVKIKVHVPYQSAILQWLCNMDDDNPHFGVRMWDTSSNNVYRDESGLWFQYTTYYSQTR